ncbi:MAG TPA: phage major capsid protein [Bryobacteraceae bacterium]|nr:phage major capsid protein [Bryobacteraceae bacterium]
MDTELTEAIKTLSTETKGLFGGLKTQLDGLGENVKAIQKQVDTIEVKASKPGHTGGSSLLAELQGNPDLSAMVQKGRGSAQFVLSGKSLGELLESKAISTSGLGGTGSAGVVPYERDSTIVAMARPRLRMRDVIPARPTAQGEILWAVETKRPTKASPIQEYVGQKPLAEPTFSVEKEPVQTIALCYRASKQILSDWPELEGFLRNEFSARVKQEEDSQILLGSGIAPNLNGLVTQGAAFDSTLLSASDGYEYPDTIAAALQQIDEDDELSGAQFVVLHPGDAWAIRRLKDTVGRYIYPQTPILTLWRAPVVETGQITKGTFLVGSGDPQAAELRDRQDLTVELSTEDGDNFRLNLVTVRFELRTALVVKRPNAFVQGSLTKSPA